MRIKLWVICVPPFRGNVYGGVISPAACDEVLVVSKSHRKQM